MATLPVSNSIEDHEVVSSAEWIARRKEFLKKEKEFTRLRDELSRERRQLPWEKVEKEYAFEGSDGRLKLADLFNGKSQLIVYHFMLGPNWEQGCPGCSFLSDHTDGTLIHLAHRDVSLVAVSRAPFDQIAIFKKRMGWKFPWVSSFSSDFNRDYHVSFSKEDARDGKVIYNYAPIDFGMEELPGVSVFYKKANGEIFHTYSSYGRGGDILINTYNYLDLAPKGRDEDGLAYPMAWMRHHDRYDDGYVFDPKAEYPHPKVVKHSCCEEEHH